MHENLIPKMVLESQSLNHQVGIEKIGMGRCANVCFITFEARNHHSTSPRLQKLVEGCVNFFCKLMLGLCKGSFSKSGSNQESDLRSK